MAAATAAFEQLTISMPHNMMQKQQKQQAPPAACKDEEKETREYIYKSKLPDIEITNDMNLAHYVFQRVPLNLDRTALVDGADGRSWTFRETELLCRKVSAGLRKLGVGQGDVVALLLPNCAEFAFVFLGSALNGSVATTCNPSYKEREITKQLQACNPKLIVTKAQHLNLVRDLGVKVVIVDDGGATDGDGEVLPISVLFENSEDDAPAVDGRADDVVCLPFSSGTTGHPKGVMLTHRSLITSVAQQVDGENPNLNITRDDVVLCLLPMFHIYSLNSVLLCCMRACCPVIIMNGRYSVSILLELVQKYRVTVLPVAPPVILDIAKSPASDSFDLSSLKLIMSGAAPLGKDIEDMFQAKVPRAVLGQGYGMTEAGPVLCMCLAFAREPFAVKSGSCGTVVRNAELKIVDPETGASLPYNRPGEICIRGSQIMKGYLNNPEATAQSIDKEGWLHTGDIAYVDEDQQVFIVDRLKEIIKVKGFQVRRINL